MPRSTAASSSAPCPCGGTQTYSASSSSASSRCAQSGWAVAPARAASCSARSSWGSATPTTRTPSCAVSESRCRPPMNPAPTSPMRVLTDGLFPPGRYRRPPWSAGSVDAHLPHRVPPLTLHLAADDLGGGDEGLRQVLHGLGEVVAVDVRAGAVVGEGLHQHEGVLVLQAARPLEPQVARLAAGRLGEVADEVRPAVGPLRLGLELDDDEVNDSPSAVGLQRRHAGQPPGGRQPQARTLAVDGWRPTVTHTTRHRRREQEPLCPSRPSSPSPTRSPSTCRSTPAANPPGPRRAERSWPAPTAPTGCWSGSCASPIRTSASPTGPTSAPPRRSRR